MQRYAINKFSRGELASFLDENLRSLAEEEALAVLENPHCTAKICQALAQNPRLTGFYSVRRRLVAHRHTPQAHASKLVHYLRWPDLLHLSVDVTVPAPIRRAIDTLLLLRVEQLTLGEKVSAARRCSPALIKTLLSDPEPRVFESLLVNQRLREEDLVHFASSDDAPKEHLALLAADTRWAYRYAIRKALVMNPRTPRAAAASFLRTLSKRDLIFIHQRAETSTYVRRCIERMRNVPG